MVSLSLVTPLPRGYGRSLKPLHLPSRSPDYGAWMARSDPSILGIAGTDDSGRSVAIAKPTASPVGLLVSAPTA